ncbi:MAG: hypothetical protein K8L97_21425 [Anaerolineae bacterium]|nr:hypothetical protein [Anaerolineae bacterium]
MREILSLMWKRLGIIASIVGDVQGRFIATLFYYTILVPFGLIARMSSDPLRRQIEPANSYWLERPPVPTELDAAKRQG